MPAFPTNESDAHHDYARYVKLAKNIHISEAPERGRKGYLCIGCGREMQAVFPNTQNHRKYFRHDAKFIKPGQQCTFKDEEYRRKLAIETLQLNKQVKVPILYKYPPKGETGLALFLLPGALISAERVAKDIYFYEGLNGSIESGFVFDGSPEELLFNADVVFYDENDEPILFIQIGKRKKLTVAEFAGLKRLSVNTINLTIPQESAAAIEISQTTGDRAKWLYHDDEQQIAYFQVPTDLGEGIPAIDGDPDRLSEETYDCRKVQVNNLLRALRRCLDGEPYRASECAVRTAIGTTELAIKRAGERRAGLETQYRNDAERTHRGALDEIERRGVELRTGRARLNRSFKNLEDAYRSTKSDFERAQRILEADIRQQEIALGGTGKTIEQLQGELEQEDERVRNRMDEQFGGTLESIGSEQERVERAIATARATIERIRLNIDSAPADLARKQLGQRNYHERIEREEKEAIADLEKIRDGRQERLEGARAELTTRFDGLRERTALAFQERDAEGPTDLSKRLKALGDARGMALAIQNAQAHNRRIRTAKEFIGTPAFQTWLSQH
ncbi:hypothetical protein [Mucilaginibacter sp. HD30]